MHGISDELIIDVKPGDQAAARIGWKFVVQEVSSGGNSYLVEYDF